MWLANFFPTETTIRCGNICDCSSVAQCHQNAIAFLDANTYMQTHDPEQKNTKNPSPFVATSKGVKSGHPTKTCHKNTSFKCAANSAGHRVGVYTYSKNIVHNLLTILTFRLIITTVVDLAINFANTVMLIYYEEKLLKLKRAVFHHVVQMACVKQRLCRKNLKSSKTRQLSLLII